MAKKFSLDQGRASSLFLRLGLALLLTVVLILVRSKTSTVLQFGPLALPYSDGLVVLGVALGGLACGLFSFVLLFISEICWSGGQLGGLYAISTYLVLILATSRLASLGLLHKKSGLLLAMLSLSLVLALMWSLTFNFLLPQKLNQNLYHGLSFWQLYLKALPQMVVALGVVGFCFYLLGPRCQELNPDLPNDPDFRLERFGGRGDLASKCTTLALLAALILSLVAILGNAFFSAVEEGQAFNLDYLSSRLHKDLRLGLTILCAAVPLAYLLNLYVLCKVVAPLKALSQVTAKYFEEQEAEHDFVLPDLKIKSQDEIELLYHSLQKMFADLKAYLQRALDNERKSAHLTEGFMLALAKAVDAKDQYTSGHSTRVANYAREMAQRLGKSPEEQQKIYVLGLLHDIGKIGIPESIINKKGRLTNEEYAKIKEHPLLCYAILQNVTELPCLAVGARWHHERFDGGGYPDGLSAYEIPWEARIIAVADAYDAMTSRRAYSDVRPQAEVRAEIVRCSGTQFDPAMASVMLQMIDDDHAYVMHEN
ncbi:MAG: HD-GYP domain-containing protein [Desulfovibrio sp.]|nr:HD-GYP domain-containing protein [Desulfovibrio sp.]